MFASIRNFVLQPLKTFSIFSTCPWPSNVADWLLTMMDSHPQSHMVLPSHGLARPCDKLKSYLFHHSVYGHQAWQNVNVDGLLNGFRSHKSHDPLNTWCCKITWQTKTLDLHDRNPYGRQTWQYGDLPFGATSHKVTRPIAYAVLQDHVKN